MDQIDGEMPLDLSEADYLAEMRAAALGEFYEGPGAVTEDELIEGTTFSLTTAKRGARQRVAAGEWVEVQIRRCVNQKWATKTAWVHRDIYEHWQREQANE